MTHSFTAAIAATQGARNHQEDAAALWPGPATAGVAFAAPPESGRLVAVLADGMGGHAGGSLASRTVCSTFLSAFARELAPPRERLRSGLLAANHAIAGQVENNRALDGMGSTLIGCAFGPDGLEWISVGDSPLYLWRRGEIAALNEDHSLAPLLDELAREGRITPEEARNDPRRHMLRAAVTGDDIDLVDLSHKALSLDAGDHIVLSSDGIHTLQPAEITRIITAWVSDGPRAVANALVREVDSIRDPHQDNFTVVVVRVGPGGIPAA